MDLRIDPATIQLHPRQPLRLRVGAGRHLTSVRGTAWVTLDGDPRDVVLEPGDSFAFDRPGRAMVQALGGDAQLVGEEGIDIERGNSFSTALRDVAEDAAQRVWNSLRRAADSFRGQA